MNPDFQNILVPLQQRLRAIWRRITLVRFTQGTAMAFGILSAVLLAIIAIEAHFWVYTPWRTMLLGIWLLTAIGLLCTLMLPPVFTGWRGRSRYKDIARHVSEQIPEAEDRVINLLELGHGEASSAPAPIVETAMRMLGDEVEKLPLDKAVSFKRPAQLARWAILPFGGLCIFLLAAPQAFMGATQRMFSPGVSFTKPVPFTLNVQPGSTVITRGDTLNILAQTQGTALPEELTLEIRLSSERRSQRTLLRPDDAGMFFHQELNVRNDLHYRLLADPVVTEWYDIQVLERPVIRSLNVDLYPPAYTQLPKRSLPPGTGNITALRGTQAEISIRGSLHNVTAHLAFESDSTHVSMPNLRGIFTVHDFDRYRIHMESSANITNADPIHYTIAPVDDRYPSVRIVSPDPETELDLTLQVSLDIRLEDDFGFSRLALYWRLAESRYGETMEDFEHFELELPPDRVLVYDWLINPSTGLDIVPNDVVEYFVRVWDNDAYSGFKSTSSATYRVRLPSLAERYEQLDELQNSTESTLESLLDDTERLREQFDELQQELRKKQDADWDDQRQLENLTEAQQELESRVDALSQAMDEAAEQMEDHGLVGDELLDMFQELQEVTEEINAPELMEALQELQEAIEELNPTELQSSLEKFKFNEEQFRERMERTLELFKNFQVQQKLEEAANRAEDLEAVQDKLSEKTSEDPTPEDAEQLSNDQRQASEEMAALEEKMADIQRRMEELSTAPQEEMTQLNEETRAKELPQEMLDNAQQMMQGQMQQANQGQQQLSQNMQQLQTQLQQVQQNMQGQQMHVNMAALQHILSNILLLSHDQEDLRQRIAETTPNSPRLRNYAQEQVGLQDGARTVIDSLQSLGRTLPQMTRDAQQYAGSALQSMMSATDALVEGNSPVAESTGREAMTHLNDLALLLSDLMAQLMNSSTSASGGGMSMEQMIEQLQQMATQQRNLNQALEDLLGQMEGERMSVDMQERLQQLASQQERMQRELQEMSRSRDLSRRLTGDLDKIAQQMEESIRELTLGQANRQMQERQQQILTRLLDASRSLSERGKQRKREGETGETPVRPSPDQLNMILSDDALQRALLQARESGYARDYQELIRRYFELLQEQ